MDLLLEEAKFILRTLKRTDLFGERVPLTEAERVLDNSISLNFGEYCGFLEKNGYLSADASANVVGLTEQGDLLLQGVEEAKFRAQLARFFTHEISVPTQPPEPVPPNSLRGRPVERTPHAIEDLLDKRYRKEGLLAEGAMATVFRARHLPLGREVAIKEARGLFTSAAFLRRDEAVSRWRERVEKAAVLHHPFILELLDQNADAEHPYVVTQLCAGSARARADGSLPASECGRIVVQAAEGLLAAHRAGVLHLGIKPENLLLDGFGNVRISDFGMFTLTEREREGSSMPPVLIGGSVVPYLAPERLRAGGPDPGPGADVYGIGVVLYELLLGKLPGRRSKMPSQLREDASEAIDDVFDRMTRDELGERYPDMEAALADLRGAFGLDEGSVPLRTSPFWESDPPRSERGE